MIKPRPALFKWRHFEPEIIVCAVRWYLRFSLSYRDVEELLMERGLPAEALGATLRTRTEQEMPAGIETNQRLLEGRRNLHLPGWELAVPVSCCRFHRRHDRLLVFRRARCGCGQAVLPESLAGSWSSTAAGHHSRRQPILPEGDRGAEAGAETGTPMPLSNLPVFKQCCGTGPSRDQAAGECQPRFSIVRWSLADDSRLRGSTHDPERPSEVVAERGCPWADSIYPGNPRIES